MKHIGFTFMLFVIVLSPLAAVCQGLPGGSAAPAAPTQPTGPPVMPALTPPDSQWRKIQRLPVGVEILVGRSQAPLVSCRFAAATDDALYCDTPENPDTPGWQFERASVVSVQATILQKNHHPGWIASMIAGGVIVGIAASSGMSAGRAAGAGAIGALVTGGIGTPLAMSTPDERWVTVIYRPRVSRQPAQSAPAH